MTGPYGNPPTGSLLRCPSCGSTNAFCNGLDGISHRHKCEDCGYDGTASAERGTARAACWTEVVSEAARPDPPVIPKLDVLGLDPWRARARAFRRAIDRAVGTAIIRTRIYRALRR